MKMLMCALVIYQLQARKLNPYLFMLKVGVDVLGIAAELSTNAIVKYKLYSRKVGKYTNYKCVWSVKFSWGYKTPRITTYSNV